MSSSHKRVRPQARFPKNLLNLTLAGLPELEHFPSPELRQSALDEIAREAGSPLKGSYWLAVLGIVVAVVTARFAARWLLSFVSWPGEVEDGLKVLVIFLTFALVLRNLHRRGVAGELRTKLLAQGVPVCVGCGYLLRGLGIDHGRCPECGRGFDHVVRRILEESAGQA